MGGLQLTSWGGGKPLNGAYLNFMIEHSNTGSKSSNFPIDRKNDFDRPSNTSRSFKLKDDLNPLLQNAGYKHDVHKFVTMLVDNSKPENEKESFHNDAKVHHWGLLPLAMKNKNVITFDSLTRKETSS